jgi:hypothetical protein
MPEADRKISQLKADVRVVYVMTEDIRQDVRTLRGAVLHQGVRLDQIEADLQGLAEGQQGLAQVQADHGRTLDEHGAILAEHGATLAEHGAKLDRILELLEGRQ